VRVSGRFERWRGQALATALTLAFAAAGGVAFAGLGLPAPYLSGAMVGATLALILRVELHLPNVLRDLTMVVLGVSMGAGVTPESLTQMARWPTSLLALVLVIVAIVLVGTLTLRRLGWDRVTAIYATAPGALSTVIILADQAGANMRRVVIAQSLRIFVLVAVLPSVIVLVEGSAAGAGAMQPAVHPGQGMVTGPAEYLVMAAAALLGVGACRLVGLPAPLLVGAMIGSAIVHGAAIVTAPVPNAVLIPCFVVLGAFIALRFRGTTWAGLKAELVASFACMATTGAVAVAGALVAHRLLGLPLGEVLVAYAPGGIEAMIIMAFALGLDVAYVATHHLVRFVAIALALPALSPLFGRNPAVPPSNERDST